MNITLVDSNLDEETLLHITGFHNEEVLDKVSLTDCDHSQSTYSAVEEEKVLFSTVARSGMFGLGMVLEENFLAYSTQFIFLK